MKMQDAVDIIRNGDISPKGCRVHFEWIRGRMLESDYFPDRNEEMITSEYLAWFLAEKFARATYGLCVNIYVVDENFMPVPDYEKRRINNRQEKGYLEMKWILILQLFDASHGLPQTMFETRSANNFYASEANCQASGIDVVYYVQRNLVNGGMYNTSVTFRCEEIKP